MQDWMIAILMVSSNATNYWQRFIDTGEEQDSQDSYRPKKLPSNQPELGSAILYVKNMHKKIQNYLAG